MQVKLCIFYSFFNLHSGGWSLNWVHSARRPLTGLLYLPRVIVKMKNLMEWMAGETEVLGENLTRRHFVHHKSHLHPGGRGGKPATNRFSYGAAILYSYCKDERGDRQQTAKPLH
jgi:hypothetical protein